MSKKKYYINHERFICIGCTSCANICPKFWNMNDKDGMADLLSQKDNKLEKIGEDEYKLGNSTSPLETDFEENLEAAESCPVNCIHIVEVDEKTKEEEKII